MRGSTGSTIARKALQSEQSSAQSRDGCLHQQRGQAA